jgi:divalent metal cation (Fe/Co/Zn/Cd) transporter
MGERDGLNILREGVIKLEKVDSMKIRIEWHVKLDTILFLSVFVGLIVGLITGLVSSMIVASIISGLLFSIIGYLVGCSFIEEQINEIVETTVNRNH